MYYYKEILHLVHRVNAHFSKEFSRWEGICPRNTFPFLLVDNLRYCRARKLGNSDCPLTVQFVAGVDLSKVIKLKVACIVERKYQAGCNDSEIRNFPAHNSLLLPIYVSRVWW
jgi:hypothetical protein